MAENILDVKIKQRYDTEANWSSANPILLKGEVAISSDKKLFKVGDGTSTWSALSYNNANSANSSITASKLSTARTIRTNLASTSTASFDGSANITPGVTGTLPVANGGTGQTTANTAANAFINSLSEGTATPSDADYYVSQYVGGGTTTTTYHRRPISALWDYIKGKISSVLGLTSSSYGGNSATATALTTSAGSATQPVYFSDGKPVATTYTLGKSVPSNAVFTDTVYTHPTTAGNKHIPSGGSSGQILRWSADGTAVWGADNNTTYTTGTTSTSGLTKLYTTTGTATDGTMTQNAITTELNNKSKVTIVRWT